MRKVFTLLALAVISAMSWAASISCSNIDFGTVSIKGQTLPVTDSRTVQVTFSGLATDGYYMYAEVDQGLLDDATNPNGFWVSPATKYLGYGVGSGTIEFTVSYSVKAAGTYNGRLHLSCYDTNYNEVDGYANITITVTNDAQVAKTTPYERIQTTSGLKAGDTVVFVNEAAGAVSGELYTTYLKAVTEGVTINASTGKAEVPEDAQTFVVSQYSGNWQFTATGTTNKLLLDITGKGAFAYGTPVANQLLAGWGIEISNGVAEVGKPDGTFPVEFNGDRFKPYKNAGSGTSIALYKKAGEAQEIQSKLTVDDVVFGDVEQDEQKSITVNYTAENLTDDILWDIEGADAALFEVTPAMSTNRTSGTVTVTYKGTATKTGALNAKLVYLTQNIALDPMEGEKAISINLIPSTIKLTNLAFSGAPTQIEQGQSIDMSQYVVYTPNNAADKSLTWTTDHDYQGTITDAGVLTAKKVTGNVVVTATSVRVPSVSAQCTLQIVAPTITDFTLSHTQMEMNIGSAQTLSVTAYVPSYASATPTYTSKNTAIATVSKAGLVTAKAIGDTEIEVTVGSVTKTCQIHVIHVEVYSVDFTPSTVSLTKGSSLQLNPNVVPLQAKNEYTMTYESNNESVATVSETGLVHGVAAGTAEITATIGGKSGKLTVNVVEPKTFAKVTDASTLVEKDTIILALASVPVVAGARDNKKLTVITSDITVSETEAYADNACRMVLGKDNGKEGFTLTIVGASKPIAVASSGNDIVDANTQNCRYWEFVADGSNGYFIRNIGNTNAMFKYHAGNAAIKPYKINTTGAVYVYAYVRKYVKPSPGTGIEDVQSDRSGSCTKVLRDGKVLIIRNGETYDLNGRRID